MTREMAPCVEQTAEHLTGSSQATRAGRDSRTPGDRSEAWDLLVDGGRLLTHSLDLEEISSTVAGLAVPRFATGCVVDLLEDGRLRRVAAAYGDHETQQVIMKLGRAPEPTAWEQRAIETRDGIVLDAQTPQTDAALVKDRQGLRRYRRLDLGPLTCIPLISRDRVLGLMTWGRAWGLPSFSATEVELLQAVAVRAAPAMDNASLYAEISRRAEQQAAITALSLEALKDQQMTRVFEEATNTVAEVLDVPSCDVLEVDEERDALLLRAGIGWEAGLVGTLTLPVGKRSVATFSLRSSTPVIVEDLAADERFDDASAVPKGAVSVLCVALAGGSGVHGVIVVSTPQRHHFSAHDASFVQSVANVLTSALERHRVQSEILHRATHDALTGLPNRGLLRDRLEHALAGLPRRDTGVALLFVDLDNFKVVNDSLGHDFGDQLLMALVPRILGAVRPSDTVARFAGDEFVVLCEDIADHAAAQAIAGRIIAALEEPFILGASEVLVSASIGIAVADEPTTASSLLRRADAAMYEAKQGGRARFQLFDQRVRTLAVHRLETQSASR